MNSSYLFLLDSIDSSSEEDDNNADIDMRIALSGAKTRTMWVESHIKTKKTRGEFNLYHDLSSKKFAEYFRNSRTAFIALHELIKNDLVKQETVMRKSISSEERLAVCLRYLSTGDSFKTIGFSYRMGESTVSSIVEEVCDSLWKHLQPKVLSEPTQEEWKDIASVFKETCQFDHCCGAIDGKHVVIRAPANSGSDYFNYKHTFSIVLLAVADATRKFTVIDVGAKGRFSDGGIFTDSVLGQKMRSGEINFPNEEPLTDGGINMPYVFVGDEAFELMPNLMRAYPKGHLTESRKIYNYRLSKARRVVENAFGILSTRWRIYKRPFECKIELVDKIVKATCVLHNYCMENSSQYFNITKDRNVRVNNENQLLALNENNNNNILINDCFFIREEFCHFFNTTGAVPWQSSRIRDRLNQTRRHRTAHRNSN